MTRQQEDQRIVSVFRPEKNEGPATVLSNFAAA